MQARHAKPGGPKYPAKKVIWPVLEGPDTPKLTMNIATDATPEMRVHKQFSLTDYVHMSGPRLPWTERTDCARSWTASKLKA